jgi:hypothetical protein
MNEAGMTDVQGNSFLGADAANIDRYIEGSYENAWRILAVTAPKAWLNNKEFKNYPLVANLAKGTGYIILPKDFYLLTALKMVGWQKAIAEAAVEDEKVSAIQSNPYTQGSIIRPVGTTTNEYVEQSEVGVKVVGATASSDTNMPSGKWNYNGYNLLWAYSGDSTNWSGKWESDISYSTGDVVIHNDELWYCGAEDVSGAEPELPNWVKLTSSPIVLNQLYLDGTQYYIGTADGLVALNIDNNTIAQVLNYYTLPKGLAKHEIEKAIYVPNVTPLNAVAPEDVLEVNQRIIEPLAYITAGCVCTIFQKDQLAANLTEKGLLMIPGYKSVKGTNVTIKQ